MESTLTLRKAPAFAGRRRKRVFGRLSQRREPPAPSKRPIGNSGAREERRGGELAMRALCSGLSAHAGSAAQAAPAAHHPASSRKGSRRWGRGEASRVSLPVVWVTSRHGNAERLAFGRRRSGRKGLRSRPKRGRGRAVRTVCPRVVSALQKSVGDVLAQRSAGAPHLSRGEAATAWPGA